MRKTILIIIFCLFFTYLKALNDTTKLIISAHILDFPYVNSSFSLYKESFLLSPSMDQSLSLTTGLYNLAYYNYAKINWDKISDKWQHQLLAQLATYFLMETALTYLPGGDAWLHEEFHRSILTANSIKSYDQVYDFPIFASTISVNRVSDQDLINFKSSSPSDFVRLSEAGIEGEYLLIDQLQKRSFFLNQPYQYWLSELNITINSIFYVFMCHTPMASSETDKFNAAETTVAQRDFVGLDFTAWVYDLFNPYLPYQDRGIHPSGTGIDRYIKPDDLYPDQYNYLKKQGYLQLINLLSPFLYGKNSFALKNGTEFNFSLRYFLTSFGTDLAFRLYLKNQANKIFTLHLFSNHYLILPGFELELYRLSPSPNTDITFSYLFGLQPSQLLFYDKSVMPVAQTALSFEKYYKNFGVHFSLSGKTKGWIPGEVYQSENFSIRLGITFKQN